MSTLPTVNVTVNVVDAAGEPVYGAAVVFRLNRLATVGGFAVPTNVTALTDAAGVAVVPLCPNALCGGSYVVRISADGVDSRGVAYIPNEDCLLDSVYQSVPYPERTYVESALVEVAGVQASATTATNAATTATTQAGLATTAAGTATTQAGLATTAAETATTKAAEAVGFSASAQGYSLDAAAAKDTAVATVASVNLPIITLADAGKYLQVDPTGAGYMASVVNTPTPTQITNAGFGVWSNGTLESAVSSVNLVTNGEFETDTSGWAAGNSATLTRDTTTYQNGAACLKITNSGATNGYASFPVSVVQGSVYKLVGYAKLGTCTGLSLMVGTALGGYDILIVSTTTTGSFIKLEGTFEAPATGTVYVDCWNASNSGGTCYYDSITLYDMGANFVTNGTFNSNTTGWTAGNGATLASVAGGINGNCLCVSGNVTGGYAYRQITGLTPGKLYSVGGWIKGDGTNTANFMVGSSPGAYEIVYKYLATAAFTYVSGLFEATQSSVYISCFNQNTNATLYYDSIILTEVTVGCVDYNTKALDLWTKDLAAVCFRETINTKAGAYYAIRVYNGAVYWSDGGRAAKPEFYARYTGRAAAIGVWVRCSSANKARIGITDSAGTTWSSYHSGGGSYEWLEVTRTPDTGITSFNVVVDSGTGTEAQFSQPQLMFGASVGSGNFVPIPGEFIPFDKGSIKSPIFAGKNFSTSSGTFNPRTDCAGKIPLGSKGVRLSLSCYNSATGNYSVFIEGVSGRRDVILYSPNASQIISAVGVANIQSDGSLIYGISASGTNTWMFYEFNYTGVQL